jgi:hypothetical protein
MNIKINKVFKKPFNLFFLGACSAVVSCGTFFGMLSIRPLFIGLVAIFSPAQVE